MREGLVAEFDSGEALVRAARALHEDGYRALDAYTPYPMKEVEEAMGLPTSPLPRYVLFFGLFGAGFAYLVMWWTQNVSYRLDVGGHASNAIPAYIPITFELGVLFAALAAFFGTLGLCGLPRLHHPLFEVEGFERASIDRYFLAVEAKDPRFDPARTARELHGQGPLRVVHLDPAGNEVVPPPAGPASGGAWEQGEGAS